MVKFAEKGSPKLGRPGERQTAPGKQAGMRCDKRQVCTTGHGCILSQRGSVMHPLFTQACCAITNACYCNAPNRAEVRRLGLLSELHAAMEAHLASDSVQEQACRALTNATCNDDGNKADAVRLGFLSSLQRAMAAHRGSAAVQKEACR